MLLIKTTIDLLVYYLPYQVFEKLYYVQISKYTERYFSKFSCGFRKGLSTHYCLSYMIEKIKKSPLITVNNVDYY